MEKLGSSLEISDKGLVVGTTSCAGLPVEQCELDRKSVVHASGCEQRALGASLEPSCRGERHSDKG